MTVATEYEYLAEFANSVATLLEDSNVNQKSSVTIMGSFPDRVIIMLDTRYYSLQLAGQVAQAIEEQFGHKASGAVWRGVNDDNRIFVSVHR